MSDVHPWMAIKAAIEAGDEDAAREALENADGRLTGRMRISADQSIRRAFPPEPAPFKSAAERRQIENEAGNASPVAAVLKRRREDREQRAALLMKHHKPSIGLLVPPKDGVEYTKPNPGGFNTPVNDTPSKKGAGREKVGRAYPA
jgi:hypothetical protein